MTTTTYSDFNDYKLLPFPVFVVNKNGEILHSNNEANIFFGVDNINNLKNIRNYYCISDDRTTVIEENEKLENHSWQTNKILNLKINEERRTVKYFSKVYKNENGLLGTLCLIIPSKSLLEYEPIAEFLPVGMFEIIDFRKLSYGNEAFCKMLGIKDSLDKIDIFDFFLIDNGAASEKEKSNFFKSILRELEEKDVHHSIIPLKSLDGTIISAQITLYVEQKTGNGKIRKIKGIIYDYTTEELWNNYQKFNLGVFILNRHENDYIIQRANKKFADLIGVQKHSSVNGKNIKEFFHQSSVSLIKEKLLLLNPESQKEIDIPSPINPSFKLNILFNKVQYSGSSFENIIGLVFVDMNSIQNIFKQQQTDFLTYLHLYSAMLNNIKDTLSSIISGHDSPIIKTNLTQVEGELIYRDKSYSELQESISDFEKNFQRFLDDISKKKISPINRTFIEGHLSLAKSKDSSYEKNLSPSRVRVNFINIRKIIYEYSDIDKIKNEIFKNLKNSIMQVLRYSRLISLSHLENEAFEMTFDIENFKNIIGYGEDFQEMEAFNLVEPLNRSIKSLESFAERRRIRIVRKNFDYFYEGKIFGKSRELFMVFYNLIHNAIKYSYIKPDKQYSNVNIYVEQIENDFHISVENRGVRIQEDEIKSKSLFSFATRGNSSKDRRRKGHGVGLYHSNKIIVDNYNGEIDITSISTDKLLESVNAPHITTFTVLIPFNIK